MMMMMMMMMMMVFFCGSVDDARSVTQLVTRPGDQCLLTDRQTDKQTPTATAT